MPKSMYLKTVAVVVTVMLICFMLQGCSRVKHYQSYHDCESLYSVLYRQVNEGDSKAAIQKLLGAGKIPSPVEKVKLLSAVEKGAQKYPQEFPYGVVNADEFLGYGCGIEDVNGCGEVFYLQFRDDKLINHHQDFKKYQSVQIISASPVK
jgi:hypothetical protein